MEKEDINICKECKNYHSLDGPLIRCLYFGIKCQFDIIACPIYQRKLKEKHEKE